MRLGKRHMQVKMYDFLETMATDWANCNDGSDYDWLHPINRLLDRIDGKEDADDE